MNPYDLSPGDNAPERITVVVEVPKGSRNKYEYDAKTGVIKLDRVLHASVHYPGDYGFVPSTLADDGDPLDVLVLVEEPTFEGCVLTARPVGVLEMIDEGQKDEKILAVPVGDPRFGDMRTLESLPNHILDEVDHFFSVYKELENKETSSRGWQSREGAYKIIREAIERGSEPGQ